LLLSLLLVVLLLQMKDLRDFAAKRSIAQLPQSLVCLADSNELAQTLLPPAVVAALAQAAVHVQLIHLTDMVRHAAHNIYIYISNVLLMLLLTAVCICACDHMECRPTVRFNAVIASSNYRMACCGVTLSTH
jgi:Protein of unknown function (DUF1682)